MAYGNSSAPEKRKAFAADYVEVADRIRAWYETYPNARIETEVLTLTDKVVVVKALVFRGETADEKPAGIGHSSMNIPGSTPYTRNSELENTETSAAGRALVMAGLPSKKVASGDEIRAKSGAPKMSPVQERENQKVNDEEILRAATTIFGQESDLVVNWIDAINNASDADELLRLGQQIAALDMSDAERTKLQNAWKAKRTAFA
jgi:hypothetical protein